jgi:hypothetical protein
MLASSTQPTRKGSDEKTPRRNTLKKHIIWKRNR